VFLLAHDATHSFLTGQAQRTFQSFFNLIGLHFPGGGLPFESPVFGIAGYVILRRGRRPCMIFIHEMLNKKKKT